MNELFIKNYIELFFILKEICLNKFFLNKFCLNK